jgi:hypothetical protein
MILFRSPRALELFAEADVVSALTAYERLLRSISWRIPASTILDTPLIDAGTLRRWNVSGFAYELLSRARTPSFTYIAPGVKTWTTASFQEIMERDKGSQRLNTIHERKLHADEVPFLLFPSSSPIREVHSSFREHAMLLLGNLTGVYLWGASDLIKFVLPYSTGENGYIVSGSSPETERDWRWREVGNDVLYQHGRCPFFPNHLTRLTSLLKLWTENVERGLFKVDENGVLGGMEAYKSADSPMPGIDVHVGQCWE